MWITYPQIINKNICVVNGKKRIKNIKHKTQNVEFGTLKYNKVNFRAIVEC